MKFLWFASKIKKIVEKFVRPTLAPISITNMPVWKNKY